MDKLTGEGSRESKVCHIFSSYVVKPVAYSKDAGTTWKKQIPNENRN